MINRLLDIKSLIASDSDFKAFLLLGPRQTGKSFMIRNAYAGELKDKRAHLYNLLDNRVFRMLSRNPEKLRELVAAASPLPGLVIIDEIQKIPELLDEVQLLLEEQGVRCLLTGSSARKLKKQGVNLLVGRCRRLNFHPLTYLEIGAKDFDLARTLSFGSLPPTQLAANPRRILDAYCGTYVKEEITAEGLIRSLPAFHRFLEVAALNNGLLLKYTSLANDAQVPKSTLIEYFGILTDTLLAFELPAFGMTRKRKPIEASKMYFFDVGVARALSGQHSPLDPSLHCAGVEFETYICHELRTWKDYQGIDAPLTYWRSTSNFEVDFVLGETAAIEVKTAKLITEKDMKGLRALREEGIIKQFIVVCREPAPRIHDGILILPWQDFLERLWKREFV